MIRKKAWPFYRAISGVRLCWELEEPKGPEGASRPTECFGVSHKQVECSKTLDKRLDDAPPHSARVLHLRVLEPHTSLQCMEIRV